MKKTINILLIIQLCFSFSTFAQENITPIQFNKIKIQNASGQRIILHQTEQSGIEVESEGFYSIENEYLNIDLKKLKGKELNIYFNDISEINSTGSIKINCIDSLLLEKLFLKSDGDLEVELSANIGHLKTNIDGMFKLEIDGKCELMEMNIDGIGELKASEFICNTAILNIDGANTIFVHVNDSLIANISGLSTFEYAGVPEVKDINISGISQVTEGINSDSVYGSLIIGDEDLSIDKSAIDDIKNALSKNKKKFNGNWGGLQIGINGYLTPDFSTQMPSNYNFLDLQYERSTNVSINFFETNLELTPHLGIYTGLGLQFNSYAFSSNVRLNNDSFPIQGYYENDPAVNYIKSKLNTTYLNIPLMFEYQTNHKHKKNSFHVGIGGIFGLKIASKSKFKYENSTISTDKLKIKNKFDYNINPFRYGLMASIGISKINLYAQYYLNPMFENGGGPEVYPFTIGLQLLNW